MEEIDIKELFSYFKNKIWLFIIIMASVVLLGSVYQLFVQAPMYSSYTTVILGGSSDTITQNDITLNKNLVNTYAEIVKSRKVLDQVIEELDLDINYESLYGKISVTSVNNTEIIKITVNDTNNINAKNIANVTAKTFTGEVINYYNMNNVNILDEAIVQDAPYNINVFRQVIIYLNHGQPLKDCSKLKMNFGDADASVTSSEFFVEKNSQALNTDPDKFIIFQPPRNDGLFNKDKDIKKTLGYEGQKLVVWLPTFRNHADGKRVDSNFDMPLGIPIIYTVKELEKFNKYLKDRNITVILKPHFAAKIDDLKAKTYSNFKIIYNSDLDNHNLTLYELLSGSDALITDYSSVYYDYLITKKPIALTLDDFNEYDKMTGFAYDYKEIIKGDYVYNIDEFYNFFDNLDKNVDASRKDRLSVIKKLGLDTTGNYSKKLFDYLVKEYDF